MKFLELHCILCSTSQSSLRSSEMVPCSASPRGALLQLCMTLTCSAAHNTMSSHFSSTAILFVFPNEVSDTPCIQQLKPNIWKVFQRLFIMDSFKDGQKQREWYLLLSFREQQHLVTFYLLHSMPQIKEINSRLFLPPSYLTANSQEHLSIISQIHPQSTNFSFSLS